MGFGGGSPSPPRIPPPAPPPEVEEDEELARKRRDLQRLRTGRSTLVIDPNPAVAYGSSFGGLRISNE